MVAVVQRLIFTRYQFVTGHDSAGAVGRFGGLCVEAIRLLEILLETLRHRGTRGNVV